MKENDQLEGARALLKVASIVLGLLVITACTPGVSTLSTFGVTVIQEADCAIRVDNPPSTCVTGNAKVLCVGKGDKIFWQKLNDADPDFTVYFDPFIGTKYPSKTSGANKGMTSVKTINPTKADLLTYKYTITTAAGCELDPPLRVDH